jgi:SET domain
MVFARRSRSSRRGSRILDASMRWVPILLLLGVARRPTDHQPLSPTSIFPSCHAFTFPRPPHRHRRATQRTFGGVLRNDGASTATALFAAKKTNTSNKKSKKSASSAGVKGFGSTRSMSLLSSSFQMDRSETTRQFYECLDRHGAGANLQRTALATSSDDGGLRGVVATKDIAKGDDIISIPYELAVNLGRQGDDPTLPALHLLREYLQARQQPQQQQQPEESASEAQRRRPYYEMLPALGSSDDYLTSTDFFTEEALRALQSPLIVEETLARRDRVQRRLAEEMDASDSAKAITLEQLQWAVWIVTSRVLTVQGETTNEQYRLLIPYLDMCNHDRTSPHVLTGRAAPDGVLRVVAGKSVKAGEFVNICYGGGAAGNDRFVQDYGFLDSAPEAYRIVARQLTGKVRVPAEGSMGGKFLPPADCERALEALGATTIEQDEAELARIDQLSLDVRTALRYRIGVKKALADLQ